jgi:hypothetical protein
LPVPQSNLLVVLIDCGVGKRSLVIFHIFKSANFLKKQIPKLPFSRCSWLYQFSKLMQQYM